MIGHILAIAGIEVRIGIRNRWVVLATAILTLFALVLAFLGAAPTGAVKVAPLAVTVASLATLSVYLVPLIALLLAFDSIAGEVDRGTLPLLLATPVSRSAVILGKALGQLLIVALAIGIGYGIACAAIIAMTGGDTRGQADFLRLIVTSIGLGAAFIAIGTIASAAVRQTGTAAALAVGIWLVAVVLYDLGLLGALVADSDGVFARTIFPWLLVANPADAFRLYNLSALDIGADAAGLGGTGASLPFPAAAAALVSLFLWVVAALGAAILVFRRLEP